MKFKLIALALAFAVGCTPVAKERALVHKTEHKLQVEASRLDALAQKALDVSDGQWAPAADLPANMVLYRYIDGKLASWTGGFPVTNDALGATAEVERIVMPRMRMRSPLSDVTDEWSFLNLGSRWYLAKSCEKASVKVIAGLCLPEGEGLEYLPLSATEGTAVRLGGEPLFKIMRVERNEKWARYASSIETPRNLLKEEKAARAWADELSGKATIPVNPRARNEGGLSIHPRYSFAKYENGACVFFRAPYPYPSRLTESSPFLLREGMFQEDGYVHFVYSYPNDVRLVISRPTEGVFHYSLGIALIAVLALFCVFSVKRGPWKRDRRNFFSRRISVVLMASLLITLALLAAVSVLFVSKRYQVTMRSHMQERLSMEQIMLQKHTRSARDVGETLTLEMQNQTRYISSASRSPLALYTTDGRLFMTTAPELIERGLCPVRLNDRAFEAIVLGGKGSLIQKEGRGESAHYGMYAPLFGAYGQVVAVMFTPYFQETYNLEKDTITHAISILIVFLILMMVSYLLTSAILGGMFRPLAELGHKMRDASLEPVSYEGNDEITPLVESYNRMVQELEKNSVQLAQMERDKAWSAMARQVAHEIKNPLTPIKLQLQRIIRLKQNGNPKWEELFDEASKVILEHVDILTETAGEFSTFAKLYTEEHVEFDLDAVLREEISMFDSRSGVRFDYFGLPGTRVSGPKPQLIRVFVNLLGNAVQACPSEGGTVQVSLRNGSSDGFYEIVFEDNGPGVSEENEAKLFTPNFTTKNGGTGLGLAISRSILDNCGASISYSRSFSLGGACFKIIYPKNICHS